MKHKRKTKHLESRYFIKTAKTSAGPCITQEDASEPQSPLEATARNRATGEKSPSSESIICASSPSKRPCPDEDGNYKFYQNISDLDTLEKSVSKSAKKRKSMEGHRGGTCLTQEDAPQLQSPVEAPTCTQAAGEKSPFSEPFICVFSPSKHPSPNEDGIYQLYRNVSDLGTLEKSVSQSARKRRSTEGHRGGPCMTHVNVPQPQSPAEAPAYSQAVGEKSPFSEPFICVFSPSKRPSPHENGTYQLYRNVSDLGTLKKLVSQSGACITEEDKPPPESPVEAPAYSQAAGEKSSSSVPFISSPRKRPRPDEDGPGPCITQEDAPQPQTSAEAPTCSQAAGGNASPIIYVSSPSKRPQTDEDATKEMPVSQDSEKTESSSDNSQAHIPPQAVSNKEPVMSPIYGLGLRPMKLYYMRVQLKRGVAVLFHTKEGLEPPSKKLKMEEMNYIGKVHKDVPLPDMSEKKPLIDCDPSLDSSAHEQRETPGRSQEPPAQGRYPRAKTPEWMVALDSGYRCMACCRVFPSLEVLQEHVENGVREGFSCHVFHRAMAHLKYKERQRRKMRKTQKATFRY